jgi:hypothetical protein
MYRKKTIKSSNENLIVKLALITAIINLVVALMLLYDKLIL